MNLEQVKIRLKSLGYEVEQGDYLALDFLIKKTEQHIKHFCNINEVPECLNYIAIDMVAGDFLKSKKSMGQLTNVQMKK